MPSDTFPTSALTLSSLQPSDTPSLLDIRSLGYDLRGPDADSMQQILEKIQAAFDNVQETLRQSSPSLQHLQIDAADIAVLFVGGQYGPGEFQVLNGPPDYADIGWIGSRAKATSVNITSIVAGLVTAAAAHHLKVGDNVYIEATTDTQNTGFYVVATTPLTTTFTVTGGVAGGNSTGGTMTKQFQGEWVKMFACGGTAFDNAPLQVDVDGSLSIQDAIIKLTGTNGVITLEPVGPSISAVDPAGDISQITPGQVSVLSTGAANPQSNISKDEMNIYNTSGVVVVDIRSDTAVTESGSIIVKNGAGTSSVIINPAGATALTTVGGGDIDVSGVYKQGGSAGVSNSQAVGVSLSITTAGIFYKDWSGLNQSAVVITGVTLNTSNRTYSGGIRTA